MIVVVLVELVDDVVLGGPAVDDVTVDDSAVPEVAVADDASVAALDDALPLDDANVAALDDALRVDVSPFDAELLAPPPSCRVSPSVVRAIVLTLAMGSPPPSSSRKLTFGKAHATTPSGAHATRAMRARRLPEARGAHRATDAAGLPRRKWARRSIGLDLFTRRAA